MDSRNKIFVVIGTIAILGAAGFMGITLFSQQDNNDSSSNSSNSSLSHNSSKSNSSNSGSTKTSSNSQTGSNSVASSYKDGTYTSTKSYSVPRGNTNSITATVVIADGKITSVTTDNTYQDHDSAEYIDSFESSVSSDAKGESIAGYSPSRIGGASLTTEAFDSAISSIRVEAKS